MSIDPTTAAVLALHFECDIVEPDGTFGALLAEGVATNIIVDGTAREASNRGLKAFVLGDCCSAGDDSIHEASLATLAMITHGVITSDDFVGSLRAAANA